MKKTLTIIIPTYNMEKYLDKCLTSLILPEEQMLMLEVLVINDGSKDQSSEIAHRYEAKYPQTFKVIDKENGNYGSCINRGLKEATGKYIKILDADDCFETNAFAQFVSFLRDNDADMILTDMSYVREGKTEEMIIYNAIEPKKVISLDSENNLHLPKLMMHYVCYRTALLHEIGYQQTEGISYTDQEWIFYPFFQVRTMCYLPVNLYLYTVGREGQTMNPQAMLRCVNHNKIITTRAFKYYQSYDLATLPKVNAEELKRQIRYQFSYLYNMYLKQQGRNYDKESLREIDKLLKENKELYNEIGKKKYHHYLPLPYIMIWRVAGVRINLDSLMTLYKKTK